MSGKIYGGTGNIGHLFVYNPATGTSTDLGQAVSGIETVASLTGLNGIVYGGTGQYDKDAHLFKYDPASGIADLGVPVAGEDYIIDLEAGADGLLYGGTGWTGHLFTYNPSNNAILDKGTGAPGGDIRSLARAANGEIYGGTNSGNLFKFNKADNTFTDLGKPVAAEYDIPALAAAPDGKLYGGTGSELGHLFSFNTLNSAVTDAGRAVWGAGKVNDVLVANSGLVYGANTHLIVFNPANHPYRSPGTAFSVDIAPVIRKMASGIGPINSQTLGANGKIYLNGSGEYLNMFDPLTGQITQLGKAVSNASIQALTTGLDGKIYGGTNAWNAAEPGRLFSYNPANGSFADLGVPVWGEKGILSLVTGADGKIYGGTGYSEGHLFVYNPANGAFTDIGRAVPGDSAVIALTKGQGGIIYGGTSGNGHFFYYDPAYGTKVDYGTVTPGGTIYTLAPWPDGRIFGGAYAGFFYFEPATKKFISLGLPEGDATLTALVPFDGKLFGSYYRYASSRYHTTLFTFDPANGERKTIAQPVLDGYNRPTTLLSAPNGVVYAGIGYSYIAYDPNYEFDWGQVTFNTDTPPGTGVRVDVYSPNDELLLGNVASGTRLAGISPEANPVIRLKATLWSSDPNNTPRLLDWKADWPEVHLAPVNQVVSFYIDPAEPMLVSWPVTISTTGDETLNWTAAGDQPWISVSPAAGTAPASITIQVDRSSFAPQTWYTGTVTIQWNTATQSGSFSVDVLVFIGPHSHLYLPSVSK